MKKNEQIVFFLPNLKMGGAEKNIIEIANYISTKKENVKIIVIKDEGPLKSEIDSKIDLISLEASRSLFSLFPLIQKLNYLQPTHIVSTLTQANLILLIAEYFLKYKPKITVRVECVLSKMVKDEKKEHKLFNIVPFLIRILFQKADEIISISNGVKIDLVNTYSIDPDKITTIFNPAISQSLSKIKDEEVDHDWFKSKKCPIVIGVGRLTYQKGFDVLVKSFCEVRKKISCRLVILGEGPERNKIKKILSDFGMSEEAWLPGFVDNPYKYLSRADVFVLSSRYEGFGNVLVEAMACGLPVIATDCDSGPSEILNKGEYGTLIPVEDLEQMTTNLNNVLIHTEKYNLEYGSWLKQFESKNVANNYLNVIMK